MADSVLYVDLDHTLIRTDSLWESLFLLARQKPWLVPLLPFWALTGKAQFKEKIASHIQLDPKLLAYRESVLAYITERTHDGTDAILATAANFRIAQDVANHLKLFSHILASDNTTNLSGERKLNAIKQHAAGKPFEYIGDAEIDVVIWKESLAAHVVTSNPRFIERLLREIQLGRVFPE